MRKEDANTGDVEFYSPLELRAMLDTAAPEMQVVIALQAFGGLRLQEALRLDWKDVWGIAGHIEISSAKSKTRSRRLVEIHPTLAAWLESYRDNEGKVTSLSLDAYTWQLTRLRKRLKIPSKKNGLRHGFLTAHFGVPVPEWTRQASYQFWKYYGFPKNFNPFASPKDFGVLIGLMEHSIRKPSPEPKSHIEKLVEKAAPKMISFLAKRVTSDLSDLEKAQFYSGKHEAAEIFARVDNPNYLDMQGLPTVYLVISAAWRKIESFETHAERIQWLKAEKVIKKITTGDEVDKYTPSDRAIYQAFEIIGLPGAKPGKPKMAKI